MSSHYATVDHPITKHCPILSARDITPKALIDLEDAHNEYFIAQEINKTNKVKKILGSFKCMHIRNWIASERGTHHPQIQRLYESIAGQLPST